MNENAPLRFFTWRELVLVFGAAFVVCSVGTFFSYNGPLTSEAWRSWVIHECSFPKDASTNGALYGPIKDIVRAGLAFVLTLFAFYRLSIVPSGKLETDRQLNWWPLLRQTTAVTSSSLTHKPFYARFQFERWMLVAFAVLAFFAITVGRPLDFLVGSHIDVPPHADLLAQIRLIYSDDFANITRPYLFPYSLYILGLWYCMAVPVLLALIRSVRFDLFAYSRFQSALESEVLPGTGSFPRNIVGLYERKCLETFAFINEVGLRYALFLFAVIVLCYIEQSTLSCSVLTGATDTGKWLLLLLSVSSLSSVAYVYLRLHYETRRRAQLGISTISDALEEDQTRESELKEATALAETVRKKDGLLELNGLLGKAGALGVIGGLFWKFVLKGNVCPLVYAIFPVKLVDEVAKAFQQHCPLP